MTLNITYFDKVKYSSIDFNNRFSDFFGNGILKTTDFPVTYPSTANMTLNIGIGTAFINGYRIYNDSVTTLTLNPSDSTNPRVDIVQIGYTATTDGSGLTTGNAVLEIKQGTAAASPVEPGADPNFIKLYSINVPANATTITSSNVTDKRALVPLLIDGSQIAFNGAQKTIYQGPTAPLNPSNDDLWIDTSVAPNILKRYDASSTSWVSVNAEDWVKSFGLGSTAVDISGTDLNTLVNTGFYRGNSLTNAPLPSGTTTNFFILNFYHDSVYLFQAAYQYGSNIAQYIRHNNNGTWSSWQKVTTDVAPTWFNATLQNGWTQAYAGGVPALQYCKIGNLVYLRGEAGGGTVTSGTVITQLPSGYRPSQITPIPIMYRASSGGGITPTKFDIGTDGSLKIVSALSGSFEININASFIAEQ